MFHNTRGQSRRVSGVELNNDVSTYLVTTTPLYHPNTNPHCPVIVSSDTD